MPDPLLRGGATVTLSLAIVAIHCSFLKIRDVQGSQRTPVTGESARRFAGNRKAKCVSCTNYTIYFWLLSLPVAGLRACFRKDGDVVSVAFQEGRALHISHSSGSFTTCRTA